MSGAPKPVIRIEYYDADGNARVKVADEACRTLHFTRVFKGTVNTTAQPERIQMELQSEPTAGATADTIALRNSSGELFATNFRGNLKESTAGAFVTIRASDNQQIATFGLVAGVPAFGAFGVEPTTRPAVSESSPTLAEDLLDALHLLGLVNKTA